MKVSDFVIEYLRQYTNHIFLLPGGNSMHLVDSVGKSGIPYTVCLHEQACAFAAIGYAEYSGKLGVCITTSAPGALNALTGCAAAYTEGVPVLFISGQTPTNFLGSGTRLMGVQGINMVAEQIKHFNRFWSTINFANLFRELINSALTPRQGSVWLEIPLDIQGKEIE